MVNYPPPSRPSIPSPSNPLDLLAPPTLSSMSSRFVPPFDISRRSRFSPRQPFWPLRSPSPLLYPQNYGLEPSLATPPQTLQKSPTIKFLFFSNHPTLMFSSSHAPIPVPFDSLAPQATPFAVGPIVDAGLLFFLFFLPLSR